MALNDIIFEGKTLSDMFSDVYKTVGNKREQLNALIAKLIPLIRTPEDLVMVGPIIKDFFDATIKNDEHIVRLVQIAQRASSSATSGDDNQMALTQEEMAQLMKNIQGVVSEQEELDDTIHKLTEK